MKNFETFLPLVNGSLLDIHYGDVSGKELIHEIITDDFPAPPKRLCIQIKTNSGKNVCIHIPYDDTSDATVSINGELLE